MDVYPCACGFYTLTDSLAPWIIGPTGGCHTISVCGHVRQYTEGVDRKYKVLHADFDKVVPTLSHFDVAGSRIPVLGGQWEIWGSEPIQ
jgi:hypothetical protein